MKLFFVPLIALLLLVLLSGCVENKYYCSAGIRGNHIFTSEDQCAQFCNLDERWHFEYMDATNGECVKDCVCPDGRACQGCVNGICGEALCKVYEEQEIVRSPCVKLKQIFQGWNCMLWDRNGHIINGWFFETKAQHLENMEFLDLNISLKKAIEQEKLFYDCEESWAVPDDLLNRYSRGDPITASECLCWEGEPCAESD